MQHLETGSRPQIMINKCMLKYLISIGSKNIDIVKIFNVGRNTVARCIKFRGFANVLRKPEDNNEVV